MICQYPDVSDYKERCPRKPRRWNMTPAITESIPQFKMRFVFTTEQHLELSKKALDGYIDCKKKWSEYHAEAIKKWGASNSYVSGLGYAEIAPAWFKDRLRQLAHDASTWVDASHAHWRAAGKQTITFRRMLQQAQEQANV